jgi:hypothetical protein
VPAPPKEKVVPDVAATDEKPKNKKRKRSELESKVAPEKIAADDAAIEDLTDVAPATEDIAEQEAEQSEKEEEESDEEVTEDAVVAKELSTFERAKNVEFDGQYSSPTSRKIRVLTLSKPQIPSFQNGKTSLCTPCLRRDCINSVSPSPQISKDRLYRWRSMGHRRRLEMLMPGAMSRWIQPRNGRGMWLVWPRQ